MVNIYVGDTVELRLDTDQDLDDAEVMEILVEKPDGTQTSWTATQYGTTGSHIMTYTTAAASGDIDADFDDAGNYTLQAYVEWGSGASCTINHGDAVILEVHPLYRV